MKVYVILELEVGDSAENMTIAAIKRVVEEQVTQALRESLPIQPSLYLRCTNISCKLEKP